MYKSAQGIRRAPALIRFVLRRTGFGGVTLPWAIYLLPERMDDQTLIRHERKHAEQIERLGVLRFYVTYAWQVLRHGYRNAPLEIEAREAEK